MSSLHFNAVLLDISNQLTAEQLDSLKFLCEFVGKRDLEKCTTGHKLFQLLTHRRKLGPGDTEFLSGLLKQIKRDDLCEKLDNFEGQPEDQPDKTERDKLDIATEVIAESVGGSWRKLGRKLRVSEVKLESICKRPHIDLEEMTVEMLKQWRKSKGAGARVQDLIQALIDCQFKRTAEEVEERLGAKV